MRVNNFASFCEFGRALTPVAPRVSLGRRPLRSAPALARRRHGGVLLRELRRVQLLLCVGGVQAPLRARCGLHRLHRYVPRAVAHRRRTPLRRRLLAVRHCDPVRGHKEKAGLAPAFSFAVAWGWRALGANCGVNAPSGAGIGVRFVTRGLLPMRLRHLVCDEAETINQGNFAKYAPPWTKYVDM